MSEDKQKKEFDGQILIDTNIFLDFYQAKREAISVLNEMSRFKSRLLFPEQVYWEFKRRRIGIIRHQIGIFSKKNDPELSPGSILEEAEELKQLAELRKKYRNTAESIAARLEKMLSDPSSDPVFSKVEELAEGAIESDIDDIEAAKNRKLLGNPPNSPDKSTMGDELIWETVLRYAKINLVIVTRDAGFLDYESILRDEFFEHTGKELKIVTKFLDAAELVGSPVSSELQKLENDLAAEVERKTLTVNPWQLLTGSSLSAGGVGIPAPASNFINLTFEGQHPTYPPVSIFKNCSCGYQNMSYSKFCSDCGKPLT